MDKKIDGLGQDVLLFEPSPPTYPHQFYHNKSVLVGNLFPMGFVILISIHNIVQIHNNVMWDLQYSHIHIEHGNIEWNIVKSHITLLWIWKMLFLKFTMWIMKSNQLKTILFKL